jgi:hypothetical protein
MSAENGKPPAMYRTFDSYVDRGKIVIITKEYSDMQGETVPVEHYISLSRAKEIIASLQDAVSRATLNTQTE